MIQDQNTKRNFTRLTHKIIIMITFIGPVILATAKYFNKH